MFTKLIFKKRDGKEGEGSRKTGASRILLRNADIVSSECGINGHMQYIYTDISKTKEQPYFLNAGHFFFL